MPFFKMNRDWDLVSLKGASVSFKKGVATFAPEFLRPEIEDKGGEEVATPAGAEVGDGKLVPVGAVEEGSQTAASGDPEGAARTAKLEEVFTLLVEGGLEEGKKPSVKDVSDLAGFHVDAAERDAAWAAFVNKE